MTQSTAALNVTVLNLSQTSALITLVGISIQRVVEILDPLVMIGVMIWSARRVAHGAPKTSIEAETDIKRAITAVASLFLGLGVAFLGHFNVLSYIGRTGFWATATTGLVLGAGTEGANSIIKYFSYLKASAKASAELSSRSLR